MQAAIIKGPSAVNNKAVVVIANRESEHTLPPCVRLSLRHRDRSAPTVKRACQQHGSCGTRPHKAHGKVAGGVAEQAARGVRVGLREMRGEQRARDGRARGERGGEVRGEVWRGWR